MNPAPRDAVQFTRESAERIAGVVRSAELALPRGKPLTFESVQTSSPGTKPFRMATFTAAWSTGTEQLMTFFNQTATPNTVVAVNQLYDVQPFDTTQPQICAIAREGTSWYFVSMEDRQQFGSARKAAFDGDWAKGSSKNVMFASGETASVTNSLYKVPGGSGTKMCIVAQEGDEWHFVNNAQDCSSGLDKNWISTDTEELSAATEDLRVLISKQSGENCVKWATLSLETFVTNLEIVTSGDAPVIRVYYRDAFVASFAADPPDDDKPIPISSCD